MGCGCCFPTALLLHAPFAEVVGVLTLAGRCQGSASTPKTTTIDYLGTYPRSVDKREKVRRQGGWNQGPDLLRTEAMFQLHACYDFRQLDFQKQCRDSGPPLVPLLGPEARCAMADWAVDELESSIGFRHGFHVAWSKKGKAKDSDACRMLGTQREGGVVKIS